MRPVHDPSLGVLKFSESQRQPYGYVGYIGYRHDNLTARLQYRVAVLQQHFWPSQVFQDIHQKNIVKFRSVQLAGRGTQAAPHIRADISSKGIAQSRLRNQVYPGNAVSLRHNGRGQKPFATSDIQHVLISPCKLLEVVMTGVPALFERIVHEVLLEFRPTLHRTNSRFVPANRLGYFQRIFDSVDVADLPSVIGGDGNFLDTKSLVLQLDDDLRIEMEVVRHPGKVDFSQRVQIVSPIAAVKFRQIHS